MAMRDRTALFLRYREEARALHRRPHSSLPDGEAKSADNADDQFDDVDSSHTPHIRRGGMEPDWVFAYNELTGDMAELEKLLEQLAAQYAQHLLPSFGEKDTSQLEREIRVRSHQLMKMLHEVERKVRNIVKDNPQSSSPEAKVELQIRRNLQKRFAAPLQELSASFRKKQKAYLDKLQEQRETYSGEAESGVSTLVDVEEAQSSEGYDTGFSETQLLTVESATALAEERTRELRRVAENVNDLATLVKDIASLVVDQGTVLDRVDYNLEEVKLKTNAAVRELRITNRYQRKRHALCCIILLSFACGIMTIILILKWTARR